MWETSPFDIATELSRKLASEVVVAKVCDRAAKLADVSRSASLAGRTQQISREPPNRNDASCRVFVCALFACILDFSLTASPLGAVVSNVSPTLASLPAFLTKRDSKNNQNVVKNLLVEEEREGLLHGACPLARRSCGLRRRGGRR